MHVLFNIRTSYLHPPPRLPSCWHFTLLRLLIVHILTETEILCIPYLLSISLWVPCWKHRPSRCLITSTQTGASQWVTSSACHPSFGSRSTWSTSWCGPQVLSNRSVDVGQSPQTASDAFSSKLTSAFPSRLPRVLQRLAVCLRPERTVPDIHSDNLTMATVP